MKVFLRLVLLASLFAAAGCAVESPPVYGGSYGTVYGEYPYTYYDEGPFIEPYPYYYYGGPRYWHGFDRDHYLDRRFEHGWRYGPAPRVEHRGPAGPGFHSPARVAPRDRVQRERR